MSPPTAIDRPSAQPASPARRRIASPLVLTVAAVVALFGLVSLVPSGTFVHRISYVNRSPYDLHVEVASNPRDGWMDAGEAFRAGRSDAQEIFDLGDTWWFRYSAQGRTSRPFEIPRGRLDRSDWTVVVPDAVARGFELDGVPVQP